MQERWVDGHGDKGESMIESRVGVEIGGTFTDLVWQRSDGMLRTHKVLSTPDAVHEAVEAALHEAEVHLAGVARIVHGSTVATNALLTRRGAMTALLTTRGFRDVIEIGTHDRFGNVYEIFYRKPRPPIPRQRVLEIDERIDAEGRVVRPIDLEAAWGTVERLIETGVQSIALCFLHSYANPAHELALAALIRERAPHVAVTASCEISPEFREYERTMTTAVNAFVGPVVESYVSDLSGGLHRRGYGGVLQIMQSNGGIMPGGLAGANGVKMMLSGPSAGVRAAVAFARRNGLSDILTLDMGGTSTDAALAPRLDPRMVPELRVDDLPLRIPAIDMVTVGAGGGSIAKLDPGGFLAVGPESTGAHPGPACYGRGGTEATVTDAQVVAGILRPEHFFGGRLELHTERARTALAAIGLADAPEEVADSVLRVVNNNMASALRLVSTARGVDPSDFVLVAYGGSGPLHAATVAEEVGIRRVLVPWCPGLVSALGLMIADLVLDLVRTRIHRLDDTSLSGARTAELIELCDAAAHDTGLVKGQYETHLALDLRYVGQAYELTVWADTDGWDRATVERAFAALHRQRYGYSRDSLPIEVVNYRGRVVQKVGGDLFGANSPPAPGGKIDVETSEVHLGGRRTEAWFVPRAQLPAGYRRDGPGIVEESTATTVVPTSWSLETLASGDLLLERAIQ